MKLLELGLAVLGKMLDGQHPVLPGFKNSCDLSPQSPGEPHYFSDVRSKAESSNAR